MMKCFMPVWEFLRKMLAMLLCCEKIVGSANQNEGASSDAPSDENPHSEDLFPHLESEEEEDEYEYIWDQIQDVLQEGVFEDGDDLAEEAIREALHPVPYEQGNFEYEADECPICLMPYSKEEEVAPLACGHHLHFECTIKLLRYRRNASCVLCRAPILAL